MSNTKIKKENMLKYGSIIFSLSVYIVFLQLYLNAVYPAIGHDYSYHFPRLLDTLLHYKINGLSIQWFSPSFGGGLPSFPNPQHLQFSLPQFLVFFFTPWVSAQISSVFFSLLGYWGFYRIGQDILKLGWRISSLGALLFMINGFIIEHAAVGHITFQTFPLVSVLLYLLIHKKFKPITAGLLIGIIGAVTVFGGSFYIIVSFVFSIAISLSLIVVFKPELIVFKRISKITFVGILSSLLITAGKLYAVYSYMRFYPRLVTVHYYDTFITSLVGVFYQILGVMSLVPFYILRGTDPEFVLDSLAAVTREVYVWESDVSFSPVLLALCIVGILWLAFNFKGSIARKNSKATWAGVFLLLISTWVTYEFITARGISYELLKKLPIINSLRINQRYVISFLLPAALFGTFSLSAVLSPLKKKFKHYWTMGLTMITLLFLGSYFLIWPDIQEREFYDLFSSNAYRSILEEEEYSITNLSLFNNANEFSSPEEFSSHVSSIVTYEALISSRRQELSTQLIEGDPFTISDGYFNFNNPVGFVYPEESGTVAYERFRSEEREMLEDFLDRKQPNWDIPNVQLILNGISLISLIASLGYICFSIISRKKNKLKQ